jgi:hypothetical protein
MRTAKRRSLSWALVLFPLVCLRAQQRVDKPEEAARIWEQMIEAKGGRSSLYQIETMVQESRGRVLYLYPKFAHGEMHYVSVKAFPDRMWSWGIAPIFGGSVATADLSANIGYLVYPKDDIRKTRDLRGTREALKDTQLVYLNESKWQRPKPVRVLLDKKVPKKVEAIETDLDGERIEFWIDRKSHLPVKIISYRDFGYGKGLEPSDTWDLSEYRPMNGIQIPHRISSFILSNNPSTSRSVPILNPKLREDLFTSPPRFEDGPDAWKSK